MLTTLLRSLRQEWYKGYSETLRDGRVRKCMRREEMIWTPDVKVLKRTVGQPKWEAEHNQMYINVISAPAPKLQHWQTTDITIEETGQRVKAYRASRKGDMDYNDTEEKIRRVARLAVSQGTQFLVLGFWGCGVYGHPPYFVAQLIKDILLDPEEFFFEMGLLKVILLVQDDSSTQENWGCFENVFNRCPEATVDHSGSIKSRWTNAYCKPPVTTSSDERT